MGYAIYGVPMSAEPLALACKLDDLKQLDNKPYIKFQTHLLNHVLDILPKTLSVTYEKLYIQQRTDKRHSRGVIMSQKQIGKLIRRHEDTAQRHLKLLEEFGCIRKTLSKHSNGLYRNQLCYEVVAPEEVIVNIKNNVLDINEIRENKYRLYKNITAKTQEGPDKNAGHINNNRNKPDVNLTNIREESPTDNFEPAFEPVVLPADVPCKTSGVDLVADVVEPQARNFKPLESETFKTEAEVARFITKAERTEVVKKVKAMRKAGEIHAKVEANYADIMVLVQHVIIHCVYRNVLRCKTFKHALNFAAKAIRNGTWTTPKRILASETAERERLANEAKELERRLCLESGFERMLGEAMRLTHVPSEADIARLKADVLERGVNSLGQNTSGENIARLKALIQKTVEDKQKERGK